VSGVVPHLVRLAAPPVRPPVVVLTPHFDELPGGDPCSVELAPYRLVLWCSSTWLYHCETLLHY
jgi:hypothetical protein